MKIVAFVSLLIWTYTAPAQSEEVSQIAIETAPSEDEQRGRIEKRNNKYGIVTANGSERVPVVYDSLFEITTNLLIAGKNGKSGIVTRDNKIVVPFTYDRITRFKESWSHLKTSINGKYGIITYEGKVIAEPVYNDIIWNKRAYFFLVKVNNKMGVLSPAGDILLKPVAADYIPDRVWDGRTVKYFYFMVGDQWGLMNTVGEIIIPANYGHLHYMEQHKLFFAQSIHSVNTFSIIDEANNVIVPPQNVEYMVSHDFIIVKKGDQYGAINVLNNQVVPFGKYDDIVCTASGDCTPRVYVRLNGKRGVMDEKGNLLTDIKYDYLRYNKSGCFIEYQINQQSGLLNKFGRTILEGNFTRFIIWTDTERILASDESGVRLYNFQGKQLSNNIFERIERNGSKKFFSFTEKGKYGLINSEGEIVVRPEFDKIIEKRSYESDIFGEKNGRRVLLLSE